MSWIKIARFARAGFLFVLRSGRRAGFCAVRENFTRKTENFDGAGFPGVSRGGPALRQVSREAFGDPDDVQGDLRKQQARWRSLTTSKPWAAEFDILRMDGRRL